MLRDFASLPTYVQLLLVTQLFFNIGFYMVLPYLATYLGESLGLAGATIGLILGLRSFSQQGLFVLGGTLTDRYGPRAIILIGIPIRIAGFVLLGLSTQLAGVVAGVVLIGFAAARSRLRWNRPSPVPRAKWNKAPACRARRCLPWARWRCKPALPWGR